MQKIRYGLIGASQIARGVHINAIRASKNSELLGIASRRATKASEWAEELAIPKAYESYDELLADPDIDAALVTLPMSAHYEWIIKAADAGKHVLCEKPMALSVESAYGILEAAKRNKVLIMEAFSHRFPPHLPYVKKLLDSGRVGPIKMIRAEVLYNTRDWENDTRAQAELGGCVTVEAGCYCANTIRFLMGDEPEEVAGYALQREPGAFDTSFVGIMRFPGNRLATMCTSMETKFRCCAEVICENARIEIPQLFHGFHIVIRRTEEPVEEVITFVEEPTPADRVGRFTTQIEHFSNCILNGTEPIITLDDSIKNTELLMRLKYTDK